MGCDIHAGIEVHDGNGWKAVKFPNPYFGRWEDEERETHRLPFGRNYDAFAILADVRNGVGFAHLALDFARPFHSYRKVAVYKDAVAVSSQLRFKQIEHVIVRLGIAFVKQRNSQRA